MCSLKNVHNCTTAHTHTHKHKPLCWLRPSGPDCGEMIEMFVVAVVVTRQPETHTHTHTHIYIVDCRIYWHTLTHSFIYLWAELVQADSWSPNTVDHYNTVLQILISCSLLICSPRVPVSLRCLWWVLKQLSWLWIILLLQHVHVNPNATK